MDSRVLSLVPIAEMSDISNLMESNKAILTSTADKTNQWLSTRGFTDLESQYAIDRGRTPRDGKFTVVQSVVGDDEMSTTNSAAFGPLTINAGPNVSRIKLSEKDTGISHYVGNMTEGYIFTPPTRESAVDSVLKRHKREGVPFASDIVKLKHLSAVRKQTNDDPEFESKYMQIVKSAEYVDRHWFTYDYHQMALIIATALFDFRNSRNYCYLSKAEGGCGGAPPYMNLETHISGMHFFNRGKSKRSIIGLMSEAYSVNTGHMKPKDTFYLRASHLAQVGDENWSMFKRAFDDLIKQGYSKLDINDLYSALSDREPLPEDLKLLGVEFQPDDHLIGVAIAHLRNFGLLYTDMDVRILLEAQKRVTAITGVRPYKEILAEIESEKRKIKSNPLNVLSRISQGIGDGKEFIDIDLDTCKNVSNDYFSLRSSGEVYTSFAYTDRIRVYRKRDVENYMLRQTRGVRSDILANMENTFRANPHIFDRVRKTKEIEEWFYSNPLWEVLNNPLPSGIGPDDSRLALSVEKFLVNQPLEVPMVIILCTSDKSLFASIATRTYRKYDQNKVHIYQLTANNYLQWCLLACSEQEYSGESEKNYLKNVKLKRFYIPFYNYLRGVEYPMPQQYVRQVSGAFRRHTRFDIKFEWDFPNIERNMTNMKYNHGVIILRNEGFLKRDSIQSMEFGWAHKPYEDLEKLSDFEEGTFKIRTPKRDQGRLKSSMSSFGSVWSRSS